MKASLQTWTLSTLAAISAAISTYNVSTSSINLSRWPEPAATELRNMISKNANQSNYAVFDMDNTSYRFDLIEALLPYLENRGILTRSTFNPTLQIIDFIDQGNVTESLFSYYYRLCIIDEMICYPWASQIFSGLTLRQLKGYVDELLALNTTIPVSYFSANLTAQIQNEINPPKVFRTQAQLFNTLTANGIEVYIVSAAHEELVRMVASDPKYGYNVKPENVIGVTTLLRNTTDNTVTTSRKQIEAGTYNQISNLDLTIDPYLWTPATWFAGKWAGILTYIDEWKLPVLVAGDTPGSDGYMLFHGVDVNKGGIHLFVNKSSSDVAEIEKMIRQNKERQRKNGREVTADKTWLIVDQEDLL